MDKFIRNLQPNKTYKVRWTPYYADGTVGTPSIAYTITTPAAPNPPLVDQTLIQVDSESFPNGIIISWPAPDPDPSLPSVEDYLVQVTDDLAEWGKFQVTVKDTKTIFSQENQLISFGQLVETIYIRVITRGVNQNFDVPEDYREYSYELEQTLRPPDIVTAQGNWYSFTVNWAFTPARPSVIAGYKIYIDDETNLETTINDPTVNTYTSPVDLLSGGGVVTIGVSSIDAENNESAINWSNRIQIEEILLDLTPPPQRQAISFSAITGTPNVLATWSNSGDAGDEILNKDLAGVTIRYAPASDPTNYIWIDVPFTYSDDLESFVITNLISNTEYEFSLSTYDILFNRTEYFPATPQSVTTDKDNVPPPKPISPTVSFGSTEDGPMTIRVQQPSLQSDNVTFLPPDTSYFQVWMLKDTYTTAPTDDSNPNATLLGDMPAGFAGLETQKMFYNASITSPSDVRYFYTRAVDTSGNISIASDAVDAEGMVIFGNAHIDNLSANKITTDTLRADTRITIGTGTGSIKIDGSGKMWSGYALVGGLVSDGQYGNTNTGFYLDNTSKFSLKDRLLFDGTNLTVSGTINAQGGNFSNNIQVSGTVFSLGSGGAISGAGAPKNAVIFNSSGIAGYDIDGNQNFLISTTGSALFRGTINASKGYFSGDFGENVLIGSSSYPRLLATGSTVKRKSTVEIEKTTTEDGYLTFVKPLGVDDEGTPGRNGVEWFTHQPSTDSFIRRASITHDSSLNGAPGGALVLRAYSSSSGATPGQITLATSAQSTDSGVFQVNGFISLISGVVTIQPTERLQINTSNINTDLWAGSAIDLRDGVSSSVPFLVASDNDGNLGRGPRITYNNGSAPGVGTPKEGDIHFELS